MTATGVVASDIERYSFISRTARSVQAGETDIYLRAIPDSIVGETLNIDPLGNSESVTVTAQDDTKITFTPALSYSHDPDIPIVRTSMAAYFSTNYTMQLSVDCEATDTTVTVKNKFIGAASDLGFVIIDYNTAQAEFRKVTNVSGNVFTIAALDYDHSANDPVLWIAEATVSSAWFGDTGDGSTEDDVAIVYAINELSDAGGGTLVIPSGTHIIGDAMDLDTISNVHIKGEGWGTVLKWKDGTDGGPKMFYVHGPSYNLAFSDMKLDGNAGNVTNVHHTFAIYGGYNLTFRNLYFYTTDGQSDFIYMRSASNYNILIEGCFGYYAGRSHYVITNGNDVMVRNCFGKRCTNTFVDLEPNAGESIARVTIEGNHYVDESGTGNAAFGVGISDSGAISEVNIVGNYFNCLTAPLTITSCSKININGNILIGTEEPGIPCCEFEATDDLIFANNYVEFTKNSAATYQALRLNGDCERCVISHNILNSTYGYGNGIGTAGSGNDHIVIDNNVITTCASYGISIGGGGTTLVANNVVKSAGSDGIYVGSTGTTVTGNIVESAAAIGINVNGGSRYVVTKNIVKNCGSSGIALQNCTEVICAENMCYDDQTPKTQTYGLYLNSANYIIISSNNFRGNLTAAYTGTVTNYKPSPNGTFATDLGNHNFIA